jgi:hypothetical protein
MTFVECPGPQLLMNSLLNFFAEIRRRQQCALRQTRAVFNCLRISSAKGTLVP